MSEVTQLHQCGECSSTSLVLIDGDPTKVQEVVTIAGSFYNELVAASGVCPACTMQRMIDQLLDAAHVQHGEQFLQRLDGWIANRRNAVANQH